MRKRNEQSLQEVLHEILKKYNLERRFEQAELADIWNKTLGPSVANQTKRVVFKNGVLTVYIDSALVKHELNMLKSRLVDSLNETVGKPLVTEIHIR